jgi:rhamnosyltransferase
MLASVIVLTKNEERHIAACLEAIQSQAGVAELEVIVIDSGSQDRTVEIASSYPVRLVGIRPEEFHHGRTRNLGATLASGEYLVYLSADALPANDIWLGSLLQPFANPSVGAVYGRQLPNPDATPERAFFMGHRYGNDRVVKSGPPITGNKYRHYQFSTVNCVIRRDVWERTTFPEDLNAYEDFVIATRIIGLGYSIVYEPAAAVFHSHNYTVAYSFRQYFDVGVLYNRISMWDTKQKSGLRSDGIRYLLEEMRYLAKRKALHRCPYVLIYEAARYAGILLGRNERRLPTFVKKRISSHHLFG